MAGVALAACVGSARGQRAVEVPLRLEDGRLLVPVSGPGGEDLHFMLSTGSLVTVLSESAVARLGDAPKLGLGGLRVPVDEAQVVPDAQLTVSGEVLDGMISSNMLSEYDVLIDAPGGRLLLQPVGPSVRWDGVALSESVRLRVYHGVVLGLDVTLNGVAMQAMLELGAPAVLANAAAMEAAGVEGATGTLEVGDAVFTDMPVMASDHPVFERFAGTGQGFLLVGAPLARDCPLALSWAHQELRTCRP